MSSTPYYSTVALGIITDPVPNLDHDGYTVDDETASSTPYYSTVASELPPPSTTYGELDGAHDMYGVEGGSEGQRGWAGGQAPCDAVVWLDTLCDLLIVRPCVPYYVHINPPPLHTHAHTLTSRMPKNSPKQTLLGRERAGPLPAPTGPKPPQETRNRSGSVYAGFQGSTNA